MLGAAFSESREVAETYPPSIPLDAKRKVVTAHLHIERPMKFRSYNGLGKAFLSFIDSNGLKHHPTEAKNNAILYRKHIEEQGFDGITFLEGYSHDTARCKARTWMAFYPEQILLSQS